MTMFSASACRKILVRVLASSVLLIRFIEKAASVRCPEPAERAKENHVHQALPSPAKQIVEASPVSITRD